ncbi:MAG: BamA/TamA family outer membrane protein [Flavobacteriaceae bacterium]|nr:BamA/TamA family outer membrane protein [Flavobacteriaceae bacterium]
MTQTLAKISLILGLTILFISCDAVKRLQEDELLLTGNTIMVDDEKLKDSEPYTLLTQTPNARIPIIGIPLGLHIYNIAEPKPDSTYRAWLERKPNREQRLSKLLSKKQVYGLGQTKTNFNDWLKRTGSSPIIINKKRTEKSLKRLKQHYYTKGWFNVEGKYRIEKDSSKEKRGSIVYDIKRYKPYYIGTISEKISSPIVDSLYQQTKDRTFIIPEKQYNAGDFENERDRLTVQMRNSGLYYFDLDYIGFDADTNDTGHKVNIDYIISDRRISQGDSTVTVPFKVHTINEVRVFTDYTYDKQNKQVKDSVNYEGYRIFGYDKLKYRPKAITDAISITPGTIFKDIDRALTYRQLGELRNFKYPNISYQEDPSDTTGTGLISTILLTPKKKYTLDFDFDAYTSTIQQFGIGFSTSYLIRNVFKGAENFEFSVSGSVGSSKESADGSTNFFNTSDVGVDAKLTFPSILFPVNTDGFIPKYMSPFTSLSTGLNAQNNIGLDRQSFNGIFSYRWSPRVTRTNVFELVNLQYVRNLNVDNYFNVYPTSYDRLNEIAIETDYNFQDDNQQLNILNGEADAFIQLVEDSDDSLTISPAIKGEVSGIGQRKDRLTEDNLIFASNFTWTSDSRSNFADNTFSRFRWKVETAGNLLSALTSTASLSTNEKGQAKTFGVVFSQYVKFETDYIRHWELGNKSIIAIRAFGGIAIPFGNSTSIPFTRSYFAGGANDNRGWRAYDLGPGSSGGVLDFNEANLKLAYNIEYRYTILGSFKGAFFVDAGNIWNVLDEEDRESLRFNGLSDLSEIAVASGVGLRYDFGFFVLRFDVGFKTHNPGLSKGARWFKEYNFKNSVLNIGINYPF